MKKPQISKPAKPGQVERYDYEYKRNGVRNLNVAFEPLTGQRQVRITERHTMQDFSHCMKCLVDEVHLDADVIRFIVDNLKTHKHAASYSIFPPTGAMRILKKLEFHYSPKHANRLNMVEIKLSVLNRRLKAFVPDDDGLFKEVDALVDMGNYSNAAVDWQFRTEDARTKLKNLYPSVPY